MLLADPFQGARRNSSEGWGKREGGVPSLAGIIGRKADTNDAGGGKGNDDREDPEEACPE
jgi:hypothetical protein